jgi:hypothetical protein
MIGHLLHNMTESTTQGFIGVTLIFIYMAVIVVTALVRIKQGDHLEHH